MAEEILINASLRETRVAVLEEGVLQDLFVERTNKRGLVGNIYKGRVSRVLPGMQAAFVDIGLERAAFLHASDIWRPPRDDQAGAEISSLCSEGQELVAQVIKDPMGTKGARLTTNISLPSRYLVFLPKTDCIGVSQRIASEAERTRLREIIQSASSGSQGGVIVRTAADGASVAALHQDLDFLRRLWAAICERARMATAKTTLYEDLPLMLRCLRDLAGDTVDKIWIDSPEAYQRIYEFATQLIPRIVEHINLYSKSEALFERNGIEEEILKALERKVPLKSGGYIVIDQTEAMTTIDVNTGAFVGYRNLEETIFKTNLEAATVIARQLRLRNLGGIIIIDFIDMLEEQHKQQVLQALEQALERDRTKSHISEISPLGLVEMTRKRTRESLSHILCEPCPSCQGRGFVKAIETVVHEIFREILRATQQFNPEQFLIIAAHEVIDRIGNTESTSLAELSACIGKTIKLHGESGYTQEQFDVVLM